MNLLPDSIIKEGFVSMFDLVLRQQITLYEDKTGFVNFMERKKIILQNITRFETGDRLGEENYEMPLLLSEFNTVSYIIPRKGREKSSFLMGRADVQKMPMTPGSLSENDFSFINANLDKEISIYLLTFVKTRMLRHLDNILKKITAEKLTCEANLSLVVDREESLYLRESEIIKDRIMGIDFDSTGNIKDSCRDLLRAYQDYHEIKLALDKMFVSKIDQDDKQAFFERNINKIKEELNAVAFELVNKLEISESQKNVTLDFFADYIDRLYNGLGKLDNPLRYNSVV
jgi:hypothetical protein